MNIEYTLHEGGDWHRFTWTDDQADMTVQSIREWCREHSEDTANEIQPDRRVAIELTGGNRVLAAAVRFPDGAVYDAILGCFRHDREAIRDAAKNTEWELSDAAKETVEAARKVSERVREYLEGEAPDPIPIGEDTERSDLSRDERFPDVSERHDTPMMRHIRDTKDHIMQVRMFLRPMIEALGRRADTHDQSKLEEPEASQWAKATAELADLEYGSEEYHEALEKLPTEHHYAANRHHPEHFDDGLEGMHLVDLVEMFADWMAAVERHDDDADIHDSIEENRERFGFGEPLASILHNTADLLDDVSLTTDDYQ